MYGCLCNQRRTVEQQKHVPAMHLLQQQPLQIDC